jgi:hypothetical protein
MRLDLIPLFITKPKNIAHRPVPCYYVRQTLESHQH